MNTKKDAVVVITACLIVGAVIGLLIPSACVTQAQEKPKTLIYTTSNVLPFPGSTRFYWYDSETLRISADKQTVIIRQAMDQMVVLCIEHQPVSGSLWWGSTLTIPTDTKQDVITSGSTPITLLQDVPKPKPTPIPARTCRTLAGWLK